MSSRAAPIQSQSNAVMLYGMAMQAQVATFEAQNSESDAAFGVAERLAEYLQQLTAHNAQRALEIQELRAANERKKIANASTVATMSQELDTLGAQVASLTLQVDGLGKDTAAAWKELMAHSHINHSFRVNAGAVILPAEPSASAAAAQPSAPAVVPTSSSSSAPLGSPERTSSRDVPPNSPSASLPPSATKTPILSQELLALIPLSDSSQNIPSLLLSIEADRVHSLESASVCEKAEGEEVRYASYHRLCMKRITDSVTTGLGKVAKSKEALSAGLQKLRTGTHRYIIGEHPSSTPR